jgi:hypothetical protein
VIRKPSVLKGRFTINAVEMNFTDTLTVGFVSVASFEPEQSSGVLNQTFE